MNRGLRGAVNDLPEMCLRRGKGRVDFALLGIRTEPKPRTSYSLVLPGNVDLFL